MYSPSESLQERGTEIKVTTVGIDLAKAVFQLHCVDESGQQALHKNLSRGKPLGYLANMEPCLIGNEACVGAHYWARKIGKLGHSVRIMSPQYVKPYIKSNNNDRNDAQGICEAVGHTALGNQTRRPLAVFGIVVPQAGHKLHATLPKIFGISWRQTH